MGISICFGRRQIAAARSRPRVAYGAFVNGGAIYGLPEDAPAVLNALVDALGGLVADMPATSETMRKALRAA